MFQSDTSMRPLIRPVAQKVANDQPPPFEVGKGKDEEGVETSERFRRRRGGRGTCIRISKQRD